ncbi:MAG: competence/damage-inducible protein A, partial [Herpetosiphon sp.]|nr:competence/damage-inducible protein A [Herpetosiphon sp.]
MNAEIIAIGTELMLGSTVDTNSAWLAQTLATVGVGVQRITLIGDDFQP